MAHLIKCPMCGHQVSSKAPTCPNCGHKIYTNPDDTGCGKVFLIVFAIGIAFLLLSLGL